jgi:hypothetical protein
MIALLILLSILHIVTAGQCGSGSTCPAGYNGIIALDDCRGYYYCVYDKPTATISCPTNTKFDPDLQVCVSASSFTCSCGGAPAPAPAPSPTTCGSGCPAGYTGILPSTNCLGYYYCTYDQPSAVMKCPTGTLFDEKYLICAAKSSVTCACTDGSAPTPLAMTEPAVSPTPPTPTSLSALSLVSTSNTVTSTPICSLCPTTTWALVGAADCSGFYICDEGVPTSFTSCPAGHLWDDRTIACVEGASCACNTAYSVTLQSTGTSQTSTNNDNSWPWYPDWMNGSKCTSDGKQPNWMGDGYLHSSEEECCEANFWWTHDCISSPSSQIDTSSQVATLSLMNVATADGSNPWYPKWNSNTCVNDGGHGSVSDIYRYTSLTGKMQ